jgi:hypothetical protein
MLAAKYRDLISVYVSNSGFRGCDAEPIKPWTARSTRDIVIVVACCS